MLYIMLLNWICRFTTHKMITVIMNHSGVRCAQLRVGVGFLSSSRVSDEDVMATGDHPEFDVPFSPFLGEHFTSADACPPALPCCAVLTSTELL